MADLDEKQSAAEKRKAKTVAAAVFVIILLALAGMMLLFRFLSPENLVSLLNNPNETKKRWAADQLIREGDAAGPAAQRAAADSARDPEIRRVAVFVLGEARYLPAMPLLVSIMNGKDPTLAQQAAYALGRMRDPAALKELLAAYPAAEKGVRVKILGAIGELGDPAGEALLQREAENTDEEIYRQAAREALEKLKETSQARPGKDQ